MKSLERVFNKIKEKNPYWSDYICLAETIKGKCFNKQTIHRQFHKLVDRDDYSKSDLKEIMTHLEDLSKHTEDDKK